MTLAYTRAGSGPPLVLFHGIGHRRQAWDAVLDRLTPHREIIAVDLPGHGESPPLELAGRPPVDVLAESMTGLFDELGLDRPHVGGNSLGGYIALAVAARGRAASVTALSPAGFWRSNRELGYVKGVFAAMQFLAPRLRRAAPVLTRSTAGRALIYAAIVARPSLLSPEQALGDSEAFLAARPAMNAILAAAAPFTGQVAPDVPVTIGWGSKDRLLSPHEALLARRYLPHARFVRLPGCGHVPMTDDPALTARVLLLGSSRPEIPAAPSAAIRQLGAAPPR